MVQVRLSFGAQQASSCVTGEKLSTVRNSALWHVQFCELNARPIDKSSRCVKAKHPICVWKNQRSSCWDGIIINKKLLNSLEKGGTASQKILRCIAPSHTPSPLAPYMLEQMNLQQHSEKSLESKGPSSYLEDSYHEIHKYHKNLSTEDLQRLNCPM